MGLEDKFYPEDGSILNRWDNFWIKATGDIGEVYQHLTGKGYKELIKTSYGVAALGLFSSGVLGNLPALFIASMPYKAYAQPKITTPLEEEIQQEARGFPRKGQKMARIGLSAISVVMMHSGYSHLTKDQSYFMFSMDMGCMIAGMSILPWNFADYLCLAQVPKPPKKTVFERAKDSLATVVEIPSPAQVS